MTKEELLLSINDLKNKIDQNNKVLRELEDKLDTLIDFSNRCDSHIRSFEASMTKRKQKLLQFDGLLKTVKSALKYKTKMNDLLTGSAYTTTASSIDGLQNSISIQKGKIKQDIIDQQNYIASLQTKLQQMQYEYNHFSGEVSTDG